MDIELVNAGSVVGIVGISPEGREWISEHVHFEPWQTMGGVIWGDHRMMRSVAEAAAEQGLRVA